MKSENQMRYYVVMAPVKVANKIKGHIIDEMSFRRRSLTIAHSLMANHGKDEAKRLHQVHSMPDMRGYGNWVGDNGRGGFKVVELDEKLSKARGPFCIAPINLERVEIEVG